MSQRGFTIVELIITISVIGILLTISVVNLYNTQVKARDSERKADINNIAKHLEIYYSSGSDMVSSQLNGYPPTTMASNEEEIVKYLRDIDPLSLRAPKSTSLSLIAATSSSQPNPTINQYIYQPLQANGTLCNNINQECRRFNLYYRLEDGSALQIVRSRNR